MKTRRAKRQLGFSLMELLIVIVIISTLYGVTAVSMDAFFSDQLDEEQQTLKRTVQSLQLQSVIKSHVLGINFDSQGYQGVNLTKGVEESALAVGERKPIQEAIQLAVFVDDRPIGLEEYEEPTELEEFLNDGEEPPPPDVDIMIFPSGEVIPSFSVELKNQEGRTVKMSWDSFGKLKVEEQDG